MIWVPFWWSRGIGGRSAVDYLMRVRDMTFIEAVSQIANDESALRKQYEKPKPDNAVLFFLVSIYSALSAASF